MYEIDTPSGTVTLSFNSDEDERLTTSFALVVFTNNSASIIGIS